MSRDHGWDVYPGNTYTNTLFRELIVGFDAAELWRVVPVSTRHKLQQEEEAGPQEYDLEHSENTYAGHIVLSIDLVTK